MTPAAKERYARYRKTEKRKATQRRYREANKEKIAAYNLQYMRQKMKCPAARFKNAMGTRIYKALKQQKQRRTWPSLMPYTVDELRHHIEQQFLPGMTWENYGTWHVDHIRPIASFDIKSSESPDFLKCWALDNLRPLWARDNQKKSCKYDLCL